MGWGEEQNPSLIPWKPKFVTPCSRFLSSEFHFLSLFGNLILRAWLGVVLFGKGVRGWAGQQGSDLSPENISVEAV